MKGVTFVSRRKPAVQNLASIPVRSCLICEAAHELDETAHRDPRRPFGNKWLIFFNPGSACDVEMDPGLVFDKFLQKHGCRYRAGVPSAGVHDVSDIGANLLAIFIVERKPPYLFACLMRSLLKAVIH